MMRRAIIRAFADHGKSGLTAETRPFYSPVIKLLNWPSASSGRSVWA